MKRISCFILSLFLLLSLSPALFVTKAEEPAAGVVHAPYIGGMPDGGFHPNAEISRAELAVMLYALGDYEPGPDRFSDVRPNAWYAEAVNALAAAGMLGGFPDGSFRPNAKASRAELVTILAAASGETPAAAASFPDVPQKHWAYRAIALAQEKGWVAGFPDGSFRPAKSVTRAEAVVILNQFLGRVPDSAAIALGEGLRFFPDVRKGKWYYEAVMEAATAHTACCDDTEGAEHWTDPNPGNPPPVPDGFYCFDGNLFAVEGGAYVQAPETRTLNGVTYTCAGSSGICSAQTEVLTLADGNLLLLTGGKPVAAPGSYRDGLYLKAGQLYAARDGYILHALCTGSCMGVRYTCTGQDGRCRVEDWTKLRLDGVDLSVFSEALTYEASIGGGRAVKLGEALRAAVRVYEAYFRVEYPLNSDAVQDYIDRALAYDILDQPLSDYELPVNRGDLALYLWRALRGRELEPMNSVTCVPDVETTQPCYRFLLALYRAGVMKGAGKEHNACVSETVSVTELATLLKRLERPEERVSFSVDLPVIRTIQYGTSGSGAYPLTAYQLGSGTNVMVLTFAIHGWEDNWDRDGEALVFLADQLKVYLEQNYDILTRKDWTVYILRCLNPDGLYLGTTNNGPGRCTTTYCGADGQPVSGKGIDMNRSFPYHFRPYTENRNYNGTAPLSCVESRALADFIPQLMGSGFNVFIDTHGWYGEILSAGGKGSVYEALNRQFPESSYVRMTQANGYLSSWAAFDLGYDGCLFELPGGMYSLNAFLSSDCTARFEAAIHDLLLHYSGPGSAEYTADPMSVEPDVN